MTLVAPFPYFGLLVSGNYANINLVTQMVSGRFAFLNAIVKSEYSFWAKRPVLSESRPAVCVTAMADNTGRFAMEKKYKELFWAKVDKSDGCWLWKGATNEKGYGIGWDGRRTQKAHRLSYFLTYGYMPELCVLHSCDVPACVNPAHLFLGTRADNNRDMHAKGRHVPGGTYTAGNYKKGTDHHATKLTEEEVRQLRRDRASGDYSYSQLAKRYGLSIGNTYRIANGQARKHVK